MYFALAGRAPFEGGDVVNKIFKQRMDDPEPLERVARGVPSAFAAVVRKLMAKDPDDRYQDCDELRGDLSRWADLGRGPLDPRVRGRRRWGISSSLPELGTRTTFASSPKRKARSGSSLRRPGIGRGSSGSDA